MDYLRHRGLVLAWVVAFVVLAAGLGARAVANGSELNPTLVAASVGAPPDSSLPMTPVSPSSASGHEDWLDGTLTAAHRPMTVTLSPAEPEPVIEPSEATPAAAALIAARATSRPVAPAPLVRTPVPLPVRTAVPTTQQATPAPAPVASCPATWFCYPRLGIAGQIVPYTDCSGGTDVGSGIRSYSCLSDQYLMGHAYTQFGLVRQWAAGDTVFAWGKRFTVSGAITQQSCGAPSFPLAPLSMQTSLTSSACGAVLVVQAR